jgi:hypothetical protein
MERRGIMLAGLSDSASSRREFLRGLFPAGALLCSGCGRLSAAGREQVDPQNTVARHKFLEDSGLTMREAFRFAFLWNYIPMMQALADQIGREKLVAMLTEATGNYWGQQARRFAQKLPKRDLDAYIDMDTLEPTVDNEAHRGHFWSLALTTRRIERTPKSYEMRVTECLWAQTFREANAADIGFASICYGDEAMAAAFDPRLKLTRTTTLMNGGDYCDFRWVWEG